MANGIFSLLVAMLIVTTWMVALVGEFNGRLPTVYSAIVEALVYVLSTIGLIVVLSTTF